MKSKFLLITSSLLAGSAISGCSSGTKKASQPNILFIMSDDHAYQAISAYGYDLLETPEIDKLAKDGAIFNKSFVTNSICAPSRAVMLTGKYSHINGKIDNIGPFNWDQDNVAKILQKNGYQTALIGKIHLDGIPQGFDYSMVLPGQGQYYNPDFIENGVKKRYEGHCTPLTTEFTLNWLENIRDKSKPFILLYHQKAPHLNWMPDLKYLDFLEDREFELPETFYDDFKGRGSSAKARGRQILNFDWGNILKFEYHPFTNKPTSIQNQLNRMNEEQLKVWRAAYNPRNEAFIESNPDSAAIASFKYQRFLRDYLRCVKSVDDGVGEVMDYLEKNGLADNTVVIYTSDQGFYLGEHNWIDKRYMYEISFRTPLIMRYPKEIKPGSVINDMVINLDLAPTFLDYAGIKAPDDMQGESFRKIVAGKKVPWRDAVYYHYYEYPSPWSSGTKRHYGLRTDRYKLIHYYYDIDEWEMFDLQKDPMEMNSVYNNPEYAEVQQMMNRKLAELRMKYGDSEALQEKFIEQSQ